MKPTSKEWIHQNNKQVKRPGEEPRHYSKQTRLFSYLRLTVFIILYFSEATMRRTLNCPPPRHFKEINYANEIIFYAVTEKYIVRITDNVLKNKELQLLQTVVS